MTVVGVRRRGKAAGRVKISCIFKTKTTVVLKSTESFNDFILLKTYTNVVLLTM